MWVVVGMDCRFTEDLCRARLYFAELGMKRHNLRPTLVESA